MYIPKLADLYRQMEGNWNTTCEEGSALRSVRCLASLVVHGAFQRVKILGNRDSKLQF